MVPNTLKPAASNDVFILGFYGVSLYFIFLKKRKNLQALFIPQSSAL